MLKAFKGNLLAHFVGVFSMYLSLQGFRDLSDGCVTDWSGSVKLHNILVKEGKTVP